MRQISARLTGLLLIFGAILGTIVAVAVLVLVWRAEAAASDAMLGTIDLLDTTLTTTSESMLMVNGTLLQMKDNLGVIRFSLEDASQTMQATANVTSSVAELIGEDFSSVVTETQLSLLSVQNSARMIDNTLSLISSIPLIGPSLGGGYRRDMPLESSINEVSSSLETVPDSLREVQSGLNQTARNFELMKRDLDDLIGTIDDIETSMASAETVMTDYQDLFTRSQAQLQNARTAIPDFVRIFLWVSTAFCVWLLIAQVGLLLHGFDLLLRYRMVDPRTVPELRDRNLS
jgi:methyl-accepting chemotaxis protein